MPQNKKALGEDEFKVYHNALVEALGEKAFKSHIGSTPPENSNSAWFDTSKYKESEINTMSISEPVEDELTFSESKDDEELSFIYNKPTLNEGE